MAEKPYKIYDRRSSSGYTNILYEGATQTSGRKSIPLLDRDTTRNISNIGRRTLLTLGRFLFANFDLIQGMVREQAAIAVDTFVPQYYGRNKVWGDKAEEWLWEWAKILNIRGWPYDESDYRRNLVISMIVDGDIGTLLTETTEGYPMIQVIPSHRIGSRYNEDVVISGEWKGRRIIDGCIVDDQGRALAHRLCGEEPYDYSAFKDISTRSLFNLFDPDWPDQVRGISRLASAVFPCQDVKETRGFEKIAQKVGAALSLMETNETGEVDFAKSIVSDAASPATDTGAAQSFTPEYIDGGLIRYMKAGAGCKIEAFQNPRPTDMQQSFEDKIVRGAMYGCGWSMDFGLDPSNVGGAPMRIVVDRINRHIRRLQSRVAMALRRVHGYALSKAINLGLLEPDVDWWKWEYQPAAEITADAKYDSDIDVQEYRIGFTTQKKVCGKRGNYWEEIQDQKIAEEKRLQEKCKAAGVDPNRIQMLTPNGNLPNAQPGDQSNDSVPITDGNKPKE